MERSATMTNLPIHTPKWRDRLQIAAQLAGILACIAALAVAAITIINYRTTHVPSPPAVQSGQ
jgi:hypothetical protein